MIPVPYMPHGHCLFWDWRILLWSIIANGVTWLAYMSIPISLVRLGRSRIRHVRVAYAGFALFIFWCGIHHFWTILEIWVPAYRSGLVVDLLMAACSLPVAVALWTRRARFVNASEAFLDAFLATPKGDE